MDDEVLKVEGMKALVNRLAVENAQPFTAMVHSEPFDYTEWRRSQWQDLTLDDIWEEASKANGENPVT